MHGTPTYCDNGNVFFINGNNLVDGKIVINSETKTVDETQQSLSDKDLDDNTILLSINGTIGNLAYYSGEKLMLGKSAAYIKVSAFDIKFVYTYLQTPSVHSYFMNSLTGTTIKNLGLKAIREMKLDMPQDIDEQKKIGDYFSTLDHLITLHQRKIDKFKNLKKAMLEKMFPKKDTVIPEFRFNGFANAWEQRKLLDNIKKITDFRGRTPKKLGMDWSDDGYLALSALNVKDGYIDFSQDIHCGNQELYDKWMTGNELHKGQVLFTTEAPMGNVAQVPDNRQYILSQRTIAFDAFEDKMTEDFLAAVLRSPNVFNDLTSLSSGGTAKGVSQRSLSSLKVIVPSEIEEQECIAKYFKSLDNLITLHQRKIDKLKNLKKAMLDQMFI